MADKPPVIGEKRVWRNRKNEDFELTVVQKGPPDTQGYPGCICGYDSPCGRHLRYKEWALIPHPSTVCSFCHEDTCDGPQLRCTSPRCVARRLEHLREATKNLLLAYGHGYKDRRCPEKSALCEACLAYDAYVATAGTAF